MKRLLFPSLPNAGLIFLLAGCATEKENRSESMQPKHPMIEGHFIYETAPFPSCHASTIVETPKGLVAAWFGGSDEGNADVSIWAARHDGKKWLPPFEVAKGFDKTGDRQLPCWNPVLHQVPNGPLLLFYKVGPTPRTWWGMITKSSDDGKSWSSPQPLPEGFLGPVRNKPIALSDGSLLCGSSTEHDGWIVHMERVDPSLQRWKKIGPLNGKKEFGAIQPTLLAHGNKQLQMLCRTQQKVIAESWSNDEGQTWSPMKATTLPNPNSGIDAVQLRGGRSLLVYNHTNSGRGVLNIALSEDGRRWTPGPVLEHSAGEYSYPAVIQGRDGRVHVTYTWKRKRIKHVVFEPSSLDYRLWLAPEKRGEGLR